MNPSLLILVQAVACSVILGLQKLPFCSFYLLNKYFLYPFILSLEVWKDSPFNIKLCYNYSCSTLTHKVVNKLAMRTSGLDPESEGILDKSWSYSRCMGMIAKNICCLGNFLYFTVQCLNFILHIDFHYNTLLASQKQLYICWYILGNGIKVQRQIQGKRAQQFCLVNFYVLMVRRNEFSPIIFEVQSTKLMLLQLLWVLHWQNTV